MAPLVVPPNSPPQLIDKLWNEVASQSLKRTLTQPPVEVEYSLVHAIMEGTRRASEFFTEGKSFATRVVGGDIRLSNYDTQTGWRKINIQKKQEQDNEQSN